MLVLYSPVTGRITPLQDHLIVLDVMDRDVPGLSSLTEAQVQELVRTRVVFHSANQPTVPDDFDPAVHTLARSKQEDLDRLRAHIESVELADEQDQADEEVLREFIAEIKVLADGGSETAARELANARRDLARLRGEN